MGWYGMELKGERVREVDRDRDEIIGGGGLMRDMDMFGDGEVIVW